MFIRDKYLIVAGIEELILTNNEFLLLNTIIILLFCVNDCSTVQKGPVTRVKRREFINEGGSVWWTSVYCYLEEYLSCTMSVIYDRTIS